MSDLSDALSAAPDDVQRARNDALADDNGRLRRLVGEQQQRIDHLERIAEYERAREALSAMAALAGHFYEALHSQRIPTAAATQMVIDWHYAVITDGVAWDADDES